MGNRKPIKKVNESKHLRQAEDGEMYATVTKFYGNSRMEVKCIDGKTLPCIMRKKFKRGHEHVQTGSFVLVGVREWETTKEQCDLLEVYSSQELSRLQAIDPRLAIKEDRDIIFTEYDIIPLQVSGEASVVEDVDDIDLDLI